MRHASFSRALAEPCTPAGKAAAASRGVALALGASVLAFAAPSLADTDAFNSGRMSPQVLYNYGDNETTRSAAMGGALRALGNGTTAPYLNPANLAEGQLYHIEGQAQITPETGRQLYGGTVVDSATARLAGAASVMVGWMDPSGRDISVLDARFAAAYPISDHLFVGLGGRYLKAGSNGKNAPFSASDPVSGGLVDPSSTSSPAGRLSSVNTVTFDAGITAKLGDYVYLSAVGQNLTYPNNGFLPTIVGGGAGVGTADFTIEVDGLADLTSWGGPRARIMTGAEYLIADHFPVRIGYRYDQGAKLNVLSAGFGYIGQQFSIEGAVKRTISSPAATTMVFSVAYFIDSSRAQTTPSMDDPHDGALQ